MPDSQLNSLFADLLAEYRRQFERGDYTGAVSAVRLCCMNGLPMPDWAASEADAAIQFYFREGGAKGRGKSGGHLARYKRDRMHRLRHQVALRELARRDTGTKGTRADAFERASTRLAGTYAQGSAAAIEDSFNAVQSEYRAAERPG